MSLNTKRSSNMCFDYQVNQFLTNFLLSSAEPLGKISDWFYGVEYQQRGSPHIHMLIWLQGAAQFKVENDVELTAYTDKIITCHKPADNPELQNLVNRQVHRHSHTCRKNTKSQCRFNYPQPPMKHTNYDTLSSRNRIRGTLSQLMDEYLTFTFVALLFVRNVLHNHLI